MMNNITELLNNAGKIKPFQYSAKYCGQWHDVASINKKSNTIRLYNQWGIFKVELGEIEELKKYSGF